MLPTIKYLVLVVAGLLIIYISSLFQHVVIPVDQRDFSHFLNYNFTKVVAGIFFLAGILIGYFLRLNPWYAGLSLFLFFPITSLIESIINKGSHNLIPFEFIMYFFYALPAILAVYLGRFIYTKVHKRTTPGTKINY